MYLDQRIVEYIKRINSLKDNVEEDKKQLDRVQEMFRANDNLRHFYDVSSIQSHYEANSFRTLDSLVDIAGTNYRNQIARYWGLECLKSDQHEIATLSAEMFAKIVNGRNTRLPLANIELTAKPDTVWRMVTSLIICALFPGAEGVNQSPSVWWREVSDISFEQPLHVFLWHHLPPELNEMQGKFDLQGTNGNHRTIAGVIYNRTIMRCRFGMPLLQDVPARITKASLQDPQKRMQESAFIRRSEDLWIVGEEPPWMIWSPESDRFWKKIHFDEKISSEEAISPFMKRTPRGYVYERESLRRKLANDGKMSTWGKWLFRKKYEDHELQQKMFLSLS